MERASSSSWCSSSGSGSRSDSDSTSDVVTLVEDTADELLIVDGVRGNDNRLPKLLLPTLVSEKIRLLGVRTELLSSVAGNEGIGESAGKDGGCVEVIAVGVSGMVDIRSKEDHDPLGRKKEVSKEVSGSCIKATLVALGDGARRLDSYEMLVSVAQG